MHYNLLTRNIPWITQLISKSAKIVWLLLPLTLIASCGWVDNTGRGANSTPVTQISFADGEQSAALVMNELDSLLLRASSTDVDGTVSKYEWNPEPVEQGALNQCAGLPDFDINIAAASLAAACSSRANCQVSIDLQTDSAGTDTEFLVVTPELQAPVGVTFELKVTDNDGGVGTQTTTFCLVAINEAPDAVADSYAVVEGETLDVAAALGVLSNDIDDEHVLNKPLIVLAEPQVLPTRARSFSLQSDGSFTYVPRPFADRSVEFIEDTFEYFITDGVLDPVSAVATVRIVAINDAPELIDDIPELETVAGVPFEADLSNYFEDPEGSALSFAIVGGSLPPSGGIVLTPTGNLIGTAEQIDEGSYTIQVAVSDGSKGTMAQVTLVVEENLRVTAVSILAQEAEVGELFSLNVSNFFDDPENQPLTYAVGATSTDADLTMNARTGLLTGTFLDDGRYTIDVSADDGINVPSRIRFAVEVSTENEAPIFRGLIASQRIELGDRIFAISGQFSDPDDDDLTYSLQGQLPSGLIMNTTTGVLSGGPRIAGNYTGLRLVATDPFGQVARSNAFNILVLEP